MGTRIRLLRVTAPLSGKINKLGCSLEKCIDGTHLDRGYSHAFSVRRTSLSNPGWLA